MPLTAIEEKLSEACKEIMISCERSLVHHAMLWKIMLKNITLAMLWCVTFISTVFVCSNRSGGAVSPVRRCPHG